MGFQYANPSKGDPVSLPDTQTTFTIRTSAPTDIWRKPPSLDVFNAPIIYKALKIKSFKSARVTCSSDWKTLYDQGGLVLVLPPKTKGGQQRWIKTGIEFYQNKPCMSVVAADEWADWSLSSLSAADETAGKMTVEVEREKEDDGTWGSVLRISLVGGGGVKFPIREVTWAFHDYALGRDSFEEQEIWVGMMAAKPTEDDTEELVVNFEGFEIETR